MFWCKPTQPHFGLCAKTGHILILVSVTPISEKKVWFSPGRDFSLNESSSTMNTYVHSFDLYSALIAGGIGG